MILPHVIRHKEELKFLRTLPCRRSIGPRQRSFACKSSLSRKCRVFEYEKLLVRLWKLFKEGKSQNNFQENEDACGDHKRKKFFCIISNRTCFYSCFFEFINF